MTQSQREWSEARKRLVDAVTKLGFSEVFGELAAKHLGSPGAMERMTAYLEYVKPKKEELIVDEMLSIRSEIDAWREKKASDAANAAYNELLQTGFASGEEA